ncbi:MAG: glycosyl transferase [Kordia sp.]|nr:MAG: glycosyl transferase [Kordia sp.]
MSVPLLSIITINYNDAQGLKKTMDSVLRQTYANFEYIVIDGNSTDTSVAQIKTYTDNRLHWISESDSGIYNAMNKGISKATGEFLLFLNSGDFLISNSVLDTVIQKLNTSYSFISCNLLLDGEIRRKREHPNSLSFSYLVSSTLSHPSTFIKREMFVKYGMYNEKNKVISDWEFFLKALGLNGESFQKINETLTVFDMNGISSSNDNIKLIIAEKEAVFQKYLAAIYTSEFDVFNFNNFKKPSKRIKLLMKIEKSPFIRKVTTVILMVLSKLVK